MRKNLRSIHNEKGVILPIVLLITALLFLFISTNVCIYHNELTITKNELSQIKIDTLFQMGRTKFRKETKSLSQDNGTIVYTFPDGIVTISYTRKLNVYDLAFSISSDDKLLVIANRLTVNTDLNKEIDLGKTN